MRRRVRCTTWILCTSLLLALGSVCAAAELQCSSSACAFVLYGGDRPHRSLTLQPNSADPRGGALRLNGFVELFPDWQPPASPAMDVLVRWKPVGDLGNGASIRAFDIAPELAVENTTASALFSARGSLTRSGAGNDLYQWTGFYSGTHFKSRGSSSCHDGPRAGSGCESDADCEGGRCEGGSPLYQDAFYDASIAEQLRGHAVQRTWIPISFLSRPSLRAGRTCGGGSNDDTPCTSDAQCTGGGTCRESYLDQAAFFSFYAKPSFHEQEGATLINRDYAGLAIEDPRVFGAPLLERYAGVACDPSGTDWSSLPKETAKFCISSLGPSIKSRHAGAVRIGDANEPTDALEVNGTLSLDTGADGTLNGSKREGSGLNLNANASATPGTIHLGSAFDHVDARGWTALAVESDLDFRDGDAHLTFGRLAGRWSISRDAASEHGVVGLRLEPDVLPGAGDGPRTAGAYWMQVMRPSFAAGSGGGSPLTVRSVGGLALQPRLADTGGPGAGVVVQQSRAVDDAPLLGTGTELRERRGVRFADRAGAGQQHRSIAVDVADQSVVEYAAALRSGMEHGQGKWHLALVGSADSSVGGSMVIGPPSETLPAARLHVQEQTPNAEVLRLETSTPGPDPTLRVFQQQLSTTDAEVTTLQTFSVEPNSTLLVEARIVARCTSGSGCEKGQSAAYVRRTLARNHEGTTVCIADSRGATDFVAEEIDEWDALVECSGSELLVRVKGTNDTAVAWQNTLMIQSLGS